SSTLILSGTNTFTGGTKFDGGTISIANTGTLGSGGVTFAGSGIFGSSTLQSTATGTLTNGITWNSGLALFPTIGTVSAAAGQTLTLTGLLSLGDNSVAQFGSTTDTGTVVVNSGAATIAGTANIAVNGGTLRVGNTAFPFLTSFAASTTVAAGA